MRRQELFPNTPQSPENLTSINQISAKNKYKLIEDKDYYHEKHTHKTTGESVDVIRITEDGKDKRQKEKDYYFDDKKPRKNLPLGKDYDLNTLVENTVFTIDRKLALSLARRKTGGYYCEITDGYKTLHDQKYEMIILSLDPETNFVTVLLDHWPGEFKEFVFIEDGSYAQVKGPITIGPKCTIDPQILRDGRAKESFTGWLRNLISRNLTKKRK